MWLSTKPGYFYEWNQTTVQIKITHGGPWVCSLKENTLQEQASEGDIGDRAQNLVFIGEFTKEQQEQIIRALDSCLVDKDEWKDMLNS